LRQDKVLDELSFLMVVADWTLRSLGEVKESFLVD